MSEAPSNIKSGFNIAEWWDQQTKPVYNKLGRNIGYYHSEAELCRGVIYVYPGEDAGDPREWSIKGLLALTNATPHCLYAGISPPWATPEQVKTATLPTAAPNLLDRASSQLNLSSLLPHGVSLTPLLIAGAAAVAVAVLLSDRRRA